MYRLLLAVLLLTAAIATAQEKKVERGENIGGTIKALKASQASFDGKVLHLDSASTEVAGLQVYADSTKSAFYFIIKVGPDGTLTNEKGIRYGNIAQGELTLSQLQYLYTESEALIAELVATKAKGRARQELK